MNIKTRVRWLIEDLSEWRYRYAERLYASASLLCLAVIVLASKSFPQALIVSVCAGSAYMSGYARGTK